MFFHETQNISGLHFEVNLGETPNGISKVACAITLNQISTHTRTSLRRWPNHFFATPVREYGHGVENDFKDFLTRFDENMHNTQCSY